MDDYEETPPVSAIVGQALGDIANMDDTMNETVPVYSDLDHLDIDPIEGSHVTSESAENIYCEMEAVLHGLSKPDFIDKLVQVSDSSESQILMYKNYLAVNARSIENCPKGSLIHRKTTERSNSLYKNACDCYTLYMFVRGETTDIEKVFTKQSPKQSVSSSQSQCLETTAIALITSLQAEVKSLRSVVKVMQTDISNLRTENDELKLSLTRVESTLNSKFAQIDSVQKEQSESIKGLDSPTLFDEPLKPLTNNVKRLQALYANLDKCVKDHIAGCENNSPKPTTPGTLVSSPSAGLTANAGLSLSDNGTPPPTELRHSVPLEQLHNTVNGTQPDDASVSPLRHTSNGNRKSYSQATSSDLHLTHSETSEQAQRDVRSTPRSASASQSESVSQSGSQSESVSQSDEFAGVVRNSQRTRRYFLGGILPSASRQALANFLERHDVKPVAIRVMESANGYSKSAKITVSLSDCETIEDEIAWPKGVYCRRWYGQTEWSDICQVRERNKQSLPYRRYNQTDETYTIEEEVD